MSRKYTQTKRIENSYRAYVRDWNLWRIKGYAMSTKTPMSFEDYKKEYRLAKLAKEPHIASSIASAGRVVTHEEARALYAHIKEKSLEAPEYKKLSSVKAIKKNISDFTYVNGNNAYYGLQGLYMSWKMTYGDNEADELFGY